VEIYQQEKGHEEMEQERNWQKKWRRHFIKSLEGEEMEGRQRDMNEEIRGPMEEELKVEEF